MRKEYLGGLNLAYKNNISPSQCRLAYLLIKFGPMSLKEVYFHVKKNEETPMTMQAVNRNLVKMLNKQVLLIKETDSTKRVYEINPKIFEN